MYDVFFLSHDEPIAETNWRVLQRYVPTARRIAGVRGIIEAHKACAEASRTSHFFVVDADNEVIDGDFHYKIPSWDKDYVHLWYARNPLNGLEYGWGGVKLFPKRLVREAEITRLDMTTSLPLKIFPSVKSVTHFNYNPFGTWRSAFREAVKLSQNDDDESRFRLDAWCATAKGAYADFSLHGAQTGRHYGETRRGDAKSLSIINNYEELRAIFDQSFGAEL